MIKQASQILWESKGEGDLEMKEGVKDWKGRKFK